MKKLNPLGRPIRHANRYLEILGVLIKYGFADLVSRSGLEKAINLSRKVVLKKADPSVYQLSSWERIRLVFEELGPTYIKFAQLLSIRGDLIPLELVTELEKLQDKVPPFPSEEAKKLIERELETEMEDLFLEFDDQPIAAGSIAQVHKAVLLTGETVAVKVQRPEILKQIRTDIEIMYAIAETVCRHIPEVQVYNLRKVVKEFSRTIEMELDFLHEATNMDNFASCYEDMKDLHVFHCMRHYSSRKVLTMEFVEGIKISNIQRLQEEGYDLKLLARRGVDMVLKQIFVEGFFHADPHPGNIMVLAENRLCMLDYGMMGKLSPPTRRLLTSILIGAVIKDSEYITRNLLRLCDTQGQVNQRDLEAAVSDIVDSFFYTTLEHIDMPALIQKIMKMFPEQNLVLPADMYLLGRSIMLLQANGERLDPQFNISEYILPYIKKIYRERLKLSKVFKDAAITAEEFSELARAMPFEIRDIMDKVKNGKVGIQFNHRGLETTQTTVERAFNRLSFAMIVAAILIGSSLVIVSGTQPLIFGIPLIGIVGFITAAVFGLWILISILRHGRM